MSSHATARRRGRRQLPPLADHLPPHGEIVCALSWKLATAWPRFVIPRGIVPDAYNLGFVASRDVLVLHPTGHPRDAVDAVVAALKRAGACNVRACPPVRPIA